MATIASIAAQRLKQLREESGKKQADVATWIKVSNPHISNIENGHAELDLSNWEVIAKKFGKDPLFFTSDLSSESIEVARLIDRMDPQKRQLAQKLFEHCLGLMEVAKNWPADKVNA